MSHINSRGVVIEISAGKVVSSAWEPLDYGENGYDGPENIAAVLISTAPPLCGGTENHCGYIPVGLNLHLVLSSYKKVKEEVVKVLSMFSSIY